MGVAFPFASGFESKSPAERTFGAAGMNGCPNNANKAFKIIG